MDIKLTKNNHHLIIMLYLYLLYPIEYLDIIILSISNIKITVYPIACCIRTNLISV